MEAWRPNTGTAREILCWHFLDDSAFLSSCVHTGSHSHTHIHSDTHSCTHSNTALHANTHSHKITHVYTPSHISPTLPPLYACNIPHYSHNRTLLLINPVNPKALQWAELGVLEGQQKAYKRVSHREEGQGCIWDQIFGPLVPFWILFCIQREAV